MQRAFRTGGAGLLLWLLLAVPAAAATVTVRVEGAAQTLVAHTEVTTSPSVVVDKTSSGGTTCAGTSAGGALELATGGDWGGKAFSFGQAVDVVKGEAHPFGSGAYWSFFVDDAPSAVGVCDYTPVDGDELLFFVACEGAPAAGCFSADPLDVRGAATAAPGAPYAVAVDEYTSPFGQTPTKAPSAGATVTGGGQTATTAADGTASLTFAERGPVTVTATKDGRVRDAVRLCVTDGQDGFCGTDVPPPPPAPCFHLGDDGRCGTADRLRPEARIVGIEHRQRFGRRAAPRELQATVGPDHSGIRQVAFSLLRKVNGRCTAFDGRTERFRAARCGRHPSFAAGDGDEVSYLLPRRLGKGRYVLHVTATDRAGNADIIEPGRSRVVFFVR